MGIMKRAHLRGQATQALRRVAGLIAADAPLDAVAVEVADAVAAVDAAYEAYKAETDRLNQALRVAEGAMESVALIQRAVGRDVLVEADDAVAGLRAKFLRARNIMDALNTARVRIHSASARVGR